MTTLRPAAQKDHFTVGINDDVSHTSLTYDPEFSIEPDNVVRAMFYGLGADGTVGANKNSIKIIGENTSELRAGIFRLRLEEVRRDDGFASALRPEADSLQLSDFESELRGLPSVDIPRALRHAAARWWKAACSCSTALSARMKSGTICRARCSSN